MDALTQRIVQLEERNKELGESLLEAQRLAQDTATALREFREQWIPVVSRQTASPRQARSFTQFKAEAQGRRAS